MDKRITLTTVFTGQIKGMKRVVKEFLQSKSIGCILQTTLLPNNNRSTLLVIEGESRSLYETRDLLVQKLESLFSGIQYSDWKENLSTFSFISQTIKKTPNSCSKDSSGANIVDEAVEDGANEGSLVDNILMNAAHQIGYQFAEIYHQSSPLIFDAAQLAGKVKEAYSSLTDGFAKNACFTYEDDTVLLNVHCCLNWNMLIQLVKNYFKIQADSPLEIYKKLVDGTHCKIIDISGLEEGQRYYVITDHIPQFSMEMFMFFKDLVEKKKVKQEYVDSVVKTAFIDVDLVDLLDKNVPFTDSIMIELGIDKILVRNRILSLIAEMKNSNVQ